MTESLLMTVLRLIIGPIYRLIFPAQTIGVDNIKLVDKHQPVIFVSNHVSYHDPILILTRAKRNLHFMTKKELFKGTFGWFFQWLGLIKVDRDTHGSGIDEAKQRLADGQAIALFPEGTTKHKQTHELLPFKYGAVKLAKSAKVAIIPVAIYNHPRLLWFRRCCVCFGHPYFVDRNADLNELNNELQQRVLTLMRRVGYSNAKLLPGRPAHNPSKQPPMVD